MSPLLFPVLATAALITYVFETLADHRLKEVSEQSVPPPLLDRLDLDKRGALISLSVQDHYVEVTTSKGSSLILMRLSDAIRETGVVEGLRVHRSHWVALNHITAATREGDKAILTLSDERRLPASRSNMAALKEAGIFPT